eukprot:2008868-Rhodomonas_salina.5
MGAGYRTVPSKCVAAYATLIPDIAYKSPQAKWYLLGLLGLFLCLAVAVLALPLPLLLRGGLWFPLLRLDRLEIAILWVDRSNLCT